MKELKIILLAGQGVSTTHLYNSVSKKFTVSKVVVEEGIAKSKFFKRRIKNLGLFKVIGQIAFLLLLSPLIKWLSKSRIQNLKTLYNLEDKVIPADKILTTQSVNSKEIKELLKIEKPDIVLISGTRIISKSVLNISKAPFINIHAGITPKYRGVHGGYWALVNQDRQLCGVTIHKVDTGIDTGKVIAQDLIEINADDNYCTYPLIQLGLGLKMLNETLSAFSKTRRLDLKSPLTEESKLWSHPSFFEYLNHWLRKKIK